MTSPGTMCWPNIARSSGTVPTAVPDQIEPFGDALAAEHFLHQLRFPRRES
jgi:hypothetical protein